MPRAYLHPTRRRLLVRLTSVVVTVGVLGTAAAAPPPTPVTTPTATAATAARDVVGPGADAAARRVVLPVDGPVVRLFVRPPQRWSRGHRGVDLAAEPGTPVRSPVSGVVEFAGPVAGRVVLTVVRADGVRSSLEPLADVVAAGTTVATGDLVGLVGAPSETGSAGNAHGRGHCWPSSCLHWGVRRDGEYVDPLGLLDPVTIVLLPWR